MPAVCSAFNETINMNNPDNRQYNTLHTLRPEVDLSDPVVQRLKAMNEALSNIGLVNQRLNPPIDVTPEDNETLFEQQQGITNAWSSAQVIAEQPINDKNSQSPKPTDPVSLARQNVLSVFNDSDTPKSEPHGQEVFIGPNGYFEYSKGK